MFFHAFFRFPEAQNLFMTSRTYPEPRWGHAATLGGADVAGMATWGSYTHSLAGNVT